MAEAKSGKGPSKKKDKDKDGKKRGLADILRDPNSNYESPGYRDAKALGTKQFEEGQQQSTLNQARERARSWAQGQQRGSGSGGQSSRPIYDPDVSDPSKKRPATSSGGSPGFSPRSGGGGGQLVGLNSANARGMVKAHTDAAQAKAKERGDRIRASKKTPQSQGKGGNAGMIGGVGGMGGGGFESILRLLGAMYANQQAPLQMLNTPGTALNIAANTAPPPLQRPTPRSLNELRGF